MNALSQIDHGTILPSLEYLEQVGGSSYCTSLLWICTTKFGDLAVNSRFKSVFFGLPFLKNQLFRLLFIKDSENSLTLQFERTLVNPANKYRSIELYLTFNLVDNESDPTRVVLSRGCRSVKLTYSLLRIPEIYKVMVSCDWKIECKIEVNDIFRDNIRGQTVEDTYDHKLRMVLDVQKLSLTTDYCDTVISGTGFSFRVHKLVLSVVSPYLAHVLRTNSWRMVNADRNISEQTMIAILHYIYNLRVDVDLQNVFDLIEQAKVFGIENLVKDCLDLLRANVNSGNANSVLKLAAVHQDEDLKKRALDYITKHSKDPPSPMDEFLCSNQQLGDAILWT